MSNKAFPAARDSPVEIKLVDCAEARDTDGDIEGGDKVLVRPDRIISRGLLDYCVLLNIWEILLGPNGIAYAVPSLYDMLWLNVE